MRPPRNGGWTNLLPEQYLIYLGNLLHGDLGISFKTKNPVILDLKTFLPATIELAVFSFIFAILLGLPLGIISAVRSGSLVDHFTRVIFPAGRIHAALLVGPVGAVCVLLHTGLGARTGRIDSRLGTPENITGLFLVDSLLTGNTEAFWSSLSHLILPSIILGWFTLALVARITRSSSWKCFHRITSARRAPKGRSKGWWSSATPCVTRSSRW